MIKSPFSFFQTWYALVVIGMLQPLWLPAAEPVVNSPDAFIFEAPGGHYDRHRVQIPTKATGVTVKITIVESYEDARWGAAAGLGLGRKKVADPEDTDVFARLSFDEKKGIHQIRLTTSSKSDNILTKSTLKPGAVLIWEADWSANRLILRLNGQVFSSGARDFPPEVLHLSVSGMKLNVEDISFTFPSP